MAKTNNKAGQDNTSDKNTRTKRTYSKEVMARARKIQAARKTEEQKKASEERKVRMAKRVEDKKKAVEARKTAALKKSKAAASITPQAKEIEKVVAAVTPTPAPTPTPKVVEVEENEIVDFAVTARKYKTFLTRKFRERKFWIEPSPYEILSYIPGTVISVDVKKGRVVEEGKQLLILEAMKMQNKVEMPFTARIKKINVKAGEKIPKDFVMIELEAVDN